MPFILSHQFMWLWHCNHFILSGPALFYDETIYRYIVYGIMSFGPLCGIEKPAVVRKLKKKIIISTKQNFLIFSFTFSVHTSRCVPRMDQIELTSNAEFLFNIELNCYFIHSAVRRKTIKLCFAAFGTFYIDVDVDDPWLVICNEIGEIFAIQWKYTEHETQQGIFRICTSAE